MKPYYEHGGITIYHGDCREILPALSLKCALVTDPPYRCNFTPEIRRFTSNKNWCRDEALPIVLGTDQYFDPRHLLGYPKVVLFGANYFTHYLPESRGWLIWDKKVTTPPDDSADCEMAWTNLDQPARIFRHLWRGIVRWGEENVSTAGGKIHANQKPVALMRWTLKQIKVNPPDLICDPYMGSGTTLLAAKREGLQAIGIEEEEQHCESAAKRFSQEVFQFEATR